MTGPLAVVATHGHCFDGLASAVVFTRLLAAVRPGLTVRYRACVYAAGVQGVPEGWLTGEENAILDYRYSTSPRLTWYFDHHVTAFASDEERRDALADASGRRVHDAGYGSCTRLIADVAHARFGVDLTGDKELVEWADRIDAARFPSAAAACDREHPVMQLAAVIEHHGDSAFLQRVVPALLLRPLLEVATGDEVRARWAPIARARDELGARVAKRAERLGEVVLVDLTDQPLEAIDKFVTYAQNPTCAYSVVVTRSAHGCKISVGYNPWSGKPRRHDLAAICRRLGGGGHPFVGAAALPAAEVERAREAARAVAQELGEEP